MRHCDIVCEVNTDEYLTSPQVAAILGRSSRTVHRLVANGELVPAMRLSVGPNGAFLFRREDVDLLIEATAKPVAS